MKEEIIKIYEDMLNIPFKDYLGKYFKPKKQEYNEKTFLMLQIAELKNELEFIKWQLKDHGDLVEDLRERSYKGNF